MIDKETYEKETIRMWDSLSDDRFKGHDECDGVICKVCPIYEAEYDNCHLYNDVYNAVERWASNHPPKKFKVSQFEYAILYNAISFGIGDETFAENELLMKLLKGGYYAGANPSNKIADYIKNCEVIKNEND